MESLKEITARLEQCLLTQKENTRIRESSAPSECKLCGDVGYVSVALNTSKRHSPQMVECECAVERRVMTRLPPLYRQASILDLAPAVQELIIDWLKNPGLGLVISGRAGRGKTYTAAAIVRSLLLIRQEVCFLRCFSLYSEIREAYRLQLGEPEIFERYTKNKYLVLDDLGAGGFSDFERRTTAELLDERMNRGFVTVVTTNWSAPEIAEKMDDRVASRIEAFSSIELVGPDRRIKGV